MTANLAPHNLPNALQPVNTPWRLHRIQVYSSFMRETTLPINDVLANPPFQTPTIPPRRILVADDDFENCQISSRVLTRSGYAVDTAADGVIAWRALNRNRYDLLLTNYKLAGMSGLELMMRLHDGRPVVPVIMACATRPAEQFARYPWLNPATMLLQPCTVAELLDSVNRVFSPAKAASGQVAMAPIHARQTASQWLASLTLLLRGPVLP